MNKPVAFIDCFSGKPKLIDGYVIQTEYDIPLYTHPVKEQKCIVKDCENHKHEGGFVGDLCKPCYQFITTGEGVYSQAYRNSHPVKELTYEDGIEECAQRAEAYAYMSPNFTALAEELRAILRKAQEL